MGDTYLVYLTLWNALHTYPEEENVTILEPFWNIISLFSSVLHQSACVLVGVGVFMAILEIIT